MEEKRRVAVITGGAQGIGRGSAQAFLAAGYRVVIADCDGEAGEEAVRELAGGERVRFVETDVASEKAVERLVETTLTEFGVLDVLINNAGIMVRSPLAELTQEAWQKVLAVNLTGPMLCARYAAPHLREGGGAIVNIASTRALMSEPDTEAYSASKGGLLALTHALSVSLGPEIRVNAISPGWIDVGPWQKSSSRTTDVPGAADHRQHPAGRVGTPEDVANLALFLADPVNGFITGQNFVVDGGMTKKMIYA
ncbi:NAD(P)-dependent dehydrogenase, short-chain alcohol dehydrogenase family [Desulfuromonas soudanensis]|uniref:NAD(P)-dependent dehydrogenase, short-chain alcohol dehydrogenase family n=1 Tax=Desulfuromonas soudanensis TaxID=1603606 RepID=A0A0M4D9N1_9BACT|nr:glucose 1-dehydrogenase [Desulfuromonas soudanensis]ALC18222.1 NAD(P)-dependent dehydrogenase, short-chain alcohol dehydrogenase family [Desulfuromonas soudanensis]